MTDYKAQMDAAAEAYASDLCLRTDDFRSDAKCDFEAGADWAREQAQAEITELRAQLSMTNSNWPHEKKALDELASLRQAAEELAGVLEFLIPRVELDSVWDAKYLAAAKVTLNNYRAKFGKGE